MFTKRVAAAAMSLAILTSAAWAGAAYQAYVKITFAKQGANKGSTAPTTTTSQSADDITIVSFDAGVVSARDPQSGLPTGKRMHKPFVIIKEVDSSSPKLFQSMSASEVFPSMVLGQAEAGVPGGTITVTLKNARISAITPIVPDAQHPELDKLRKYEAISLVFERMDVQHAPSGKLESFAY